VGLGNPGPEYSRTRHNAGFRFTDGLARQFDSPFSSEQRFHGDLARIRQAGIDCRILKPMTFMNDSGRAVRTVLEYFDIDPQEMLVAHDEIDLDSGAVRLK